MRCGSKNWIYGNRNKEKNAQTTESKGTDRPAKVWQVSGDKSTSTIFFLRGKLRHRIETIVIKLKMVKGGVKQRLPFGCQPVRNWLLFLARSTATVFS